MEDLDNDLGNANRELSVKEADKFLPIANVSKIMKKVLPANAKISKDAKDMVQECVSEFVSLVTSEAADKCQREKRKMINGDNLLSSMSTLGLVNYVVILRIYLEKYRKMEEEKATSTARHGDKDGVGSSVGGSEIVGFNQTSGGGGNHRDMDGSGSNNVGGGSGGSEIVGYNCWQNDVTYFMESNLYFRE